MATSKLQGPGKASDAAPPSFIQTVIHHLANWLEVYLWVPVTLVGVFAAAELSYFLTGRRPVENADWLVDYSSKAVQAVAIIALTSIAKQALGSWMNLDAKLANPYVYAINTASTLVMLGVVTYIFVH